MEKINCSTLIEQPPKMAVSSLRFLFRCDQREQQNTPLFLKEKGGAGESPAHSFTLIELLVDTFISSVRFFKCGDKLEPQNTPLFLKEKGGAGERGNFFSREKKFPLSPRTRPFHFNRIAGRYCHYSDIGSSAPARSAERTRPGAICRLSE